METLKTKDYWTIVALMVAGHTPLDVEPKLFEETGRCQLTYIFDKEKAQDDYEKWMLGANDEPLGTVRRTKEVVEGFKHNLHRFNPK